MHSSTTIREASSWSRWKLTQTHYWTMCREWDCRALNPTWTVFIKLLPSRLRDLYRREGGKSIKSQRAWLTLRKRHLPNKRTEAWVHRAYGSTCKTHISSNEIKPQHCEHGTQSPTLYPRSYLELTPAGKEKVTFLQ